MEISEKLLVEQAWSLKRKLERQLEFNGHSCRMGRIADCLPSTKIDNLYSVHERAYTRYIRRLMKFWA